MLLLLLLLLLLLPLRLLLLLQLLCNSSSCLFKLWQKACCLSTRWMTSGARLQRRGSLT